MKLSIETQQKVLETVKQFHQCDSPDKILEDLQHLMYRFATQNPEMLPPSGDELLSLHQASLFIGSLIRLFPTM